MPTRSDIQDGDQSIPNMDTQGSRPIRKRTLTAKGLKYRQEIAEVDFKSSIRLWRRQLTNLQSLMLTTLDFEELQRERGKFEARIEDVRDAHKRILDVLENEDPGLNISNKYDHCINESQKVIDRLDDKMAELRTRDFDSRSQMSHRSRSTRSAFDHHVASRKSYSSRSKSIRSSQKSHSRSTTLLPSEKREMVAKAARLQAELEYHDVEVKGAAELQKKKDDIKKLMMLKELAVTNAEIEAVNKVEEEEFGFPSLNQRSLQDNADNRDDRLHNYLETQVKSISSNFGQDSCMSSNQKNLSSSQAPAGQTTPPINVEFKQMIQI